MKYKEFLLLKIILPLADSIKGLYITKWLKKIEEMKKWSPEDVQKWQDANIKDFINHAYYHTSYYKRLFDENGLSPSDINSKEDLKKIPIITKDIIREHYDEIIPDDVGIFRHRFCVTGGTTGDPMHYICDENTWGYVTAAKIYYWKHAGYHYGDKFVALGSASILSLKPSISRRIYDFIRGEIGMNSMGIDDSTCKKYLETIRKRRIKFIYGYASSIFVFAQYINNSEEEIPQIKAIFTTSENLTDHYREVIESAFNCKVMDCYGAKDAGITGYEIGHNQYAVGYNAIVETLEDGTLLSTNFLNNCFPLIRYDFGDSGKITNDENCYNGQLISNIYGRKSDVIRLSNGRVLTAPGFTILMPKFDIKAFQIIPKSGDSIILKIQPIPNKFSKEQEDCLLSEMRRYVGSGCNVFIEYVDGFKQLSNGKRTFFIN